MMGTILEKLLQKHKCLLLAFEAMYSLSYSTFDFAFLFAPTHSVERGFAKFLPNFCLTQEKIFKAEKILKGTLVWIPSPSPSVKMSGKVCLRHKGKTLLGIVNKLFVFKSLLTTSSNVLSIHLSRP